MPFNIYFHVAVMGEWKKSFDLVNSYITRSGILSDCNQIVYCVCGDFAQAQEYIKSDNLCWLSPTVDNFEFPTINFLREDLIQNDLSALYVHTKGAATGINAAIEDWIGVMCHFNINHYKMSLEYLNHRDAVGVDYHTLPFRHFSGNFWWSKSSHVRKLPALYNQDRHAAERWICSEPGDYTSMHDTGINVYERHLHLYPWSEYIKNS